MTIEKVKATGLWKMSLGPQENDPHADSRSRLASELLKIRANVEPIVARIASVLPGLTVHDVTHLDALWETADLIAGKNYPLNALEGFVFGVSILLHDSAMCWEAYENGQQGVRNTTQWKDAYSAECDRLPNGNDNDRQHAADFSAIRALHAQQAEKLPSIAWTNPDTSDQLFLIDDTDLRTDLGLFAGKIAASHHWSIDDLPGLGHQFNAPSIFPSEWTIDPVKIACLLRCADAAHINQARAPLFLYSLLRRHGISGAHWQAQRRLMGPSLDRGDAAGHSIIYTASPPFKEIDAASWWIAQEAVVMVDREIKQTNELLRSRNLPDAPAFQVRNVTGAQSIQDLTKLLPTEGWEPCSAQPHISNVESLIQELGGRKLYGEGIDGFEVVIRELIQNARDAIAARRLVDTSFEGSIVVRFEPRADELWLVVDDEGTGMSRRVLTGPLLDFGQSFWKSSLVHSEFPGLRSSKFRPVGKFGIGFYSVFMIADRVEVTSRKWDAGLDEQNTLVFDNGATMRPILRPGRCSGIPSQTSTRVALRLKRGWQGEGGTLPVKPPYMGADQIEVSVTDYISALVIGLDVKVTVHTPWVGTREVHLGRPGVSPNAKEVLERVSFAKSRESHELTVAIESAHSRLRPIGTTEHTYGLAAVSSILSQDQMLLGLSTIGGLAASLQTRYGNVFVGYIDQKANSAKRDIGGFDSPDDLMKAWLDEQVSLLSTADLTDLERVAAGLNVQALQGDPTDFALLIVTVENADSFFTYPELAFLAESIPVAFLKSEQIDAVECYGQFTPVAGFATFRAFSPGRALGLRLEDGMPSDPSSVAFWLDKAIKATGRRATWKTQPTELLSSFGTPLQIVSVSSDPT